MDHCWIMSVERRVFHISHPRVSGLNKSIARIACVDGDTRLTYRKTSLRITMRIEPFTTSCDTTCATLYRAFL